MTYNKRTLLTITAVLVLISALLLYFSYSVFLQLFIAVALAYILNPAVAFMQKHGINRIISILIVFTCAMLAFAGFTAFLVVSISSELSSIQLSLPDYVQRLYEITPPSLKSYLGIETPQALSQRLSELVQQIRGMSPGMVKPVLQFLQQFFSSTLSVILAALGYLIIPVYLFYLLADLSRLKRFLESFVPERYLDIYNARLNEVDTVLSAFIRGQLSICAILAVLYSIGLYLIGIDLAIAIGTLAGAAFIIPYVGTIIGILLSMIMAALKFHDILHPLLCLGWFCIVQALEGMLITPKIVGDSVGLHPLVTIVALLIGGQVFGLFGMLVAVPFTAVLQVFMRSMAANYRNSEFFRKA
ncbi:MAG TPA: AI-2E family transporter [Deltaproteobacteria bacterium]|nr:AI-2E family transporter [Deltaproteobacteria bacterium]HQB39382.1 AI-2E family transporter [Deltaproteobacteria bacterium]